MFLTGKKIILQVASQGVHLLLIHKHKSLTLVIQLNKSAILIKTVIKLM